MKKIIYLMAAAATFAACNSGNKGYEIKGSVEGATDGDYVYLQQVQGRNMIKLDSAVIENGAFTFKGVQDTAVYRYLTFKSYTDQAMGVDFFLENGNIQVALTQQNSSAVGTANNDTYQAIRNQVNALAQKIQAGYQALSDTTLTEEQRAAKMQELEAIDAELNGIAKKAIKDNINNPVGVEMLKQNFYSMSVEELDPLMSQIPAMYQNDPTIQRIQENVNKMKKTAVGQKFTDFTMNTPEGKEVKLSDFIGGKNKVVLVDFWASWCGPCRREMPNLVEAYKQYKKKGLEIVGVSLDRNADDWKKGIKDLHITWPQMSDLKFWNCEGAQLYAVSSIPHVLLLDAEGTIIARGLHGEELQKKLAEILK